LLLDPDLCFQVQTRLKVLMKADQTNRPWHPLRRIFFRLAFIFFTLEIFAMEFFVLVLFGGKSFISLATSAHKIFTPPFLYLNNRIFHFYYHPWGGYTFTNSLNLVRHITYLLLAVIGCAIWSVVDRQRPNYNKLAFWSNKVICVCLSGVMWGYGILKIFPVQMAMPDFADLLTPVGNLHPLTLLWTTLGYGTPYQIFTGIGEASAAILILFRRTRPIGLLILLVILSNVVILNYTYSVGVLGFSFLLLLMTIYLLSPHLKNLWLFFFSDQSVNQFTSHPQYGFTTPWKKFTIVALSVLVVGCTYIVNFNKAYSRYSEGSARSESKEYWEAKNFVLNGDTLAHLIEGDTIRWRYWSESVTNNALLVTLHTMNNGASETYSLTKDSVVHTLTLKENNTQHVAPILFTYSEIDKTNRRVQGIMKGQHIVADLRKINPVSTLKLLRVKRRMFETDPEEYY
jgi:hypothetical protein